eukprot:SAG25_NODE_807_length_5249_cov_3.894369_2_plen_212_part_00
MRSCRGSSSSLSGSTTSSALQALTDATKAQVRAMMQAQQLDAKLAEVELAAAEPLQVGGGNDDDGSDGDYCDGESSSTTIVQVGMMAAPTRTVARTKVYPFRGRAWTRLGREAWGRTRVGMYGLGRGVDYESWCSSSSSFHSHPSFIATPPSRRNTCFRAAVAVRWSWIQPSPPPRPLPPPWGQGSAASHAIIVLRGLAHCAWTRPRSIFL